MRWRRLSLASAAMAAILAVLLGCSCVMCLRDACSMDAAPEWILAACVAASMVAIAAASCRRGGLLAFLIFGICCAVIVWKRTVFISSLEAVLWSVTTEYAEAFEHVRVLGSAGTDHIWVLALAGGVLSWITAWVLIREGSVLVIALAAAPSLVLSLMIVDQAPPVWLVLLCGCMLVLVVSSGVRERNPEEGGRLAWWLVLPTIILLCAVTALWPPADYVRSGWSETLRDLAETGSAVESWREQLFSSNPRWNRELKTVDLSRLGPKTMTGTPVLEYQSDGPVQYLRGLSLGIYGDNAWNALTSDDFSSWSGAELQTSHAVPEYTLEIKTGTGKPQIYTTYCLTELPEEGLAVDDAYVRNANQALRYTVQYGSGRGELPESYTSFARQAYLQLPPELAEELLAFLEEHGLQGVSAQTLAEFVRNWGTYDLDTPSIPTDREFVLYFLRESKRGYCVHFATSTVMLLRANGIPARYVTGYRVTGEEGQWNQVTSDDAHAWVEYYTADQGWLPLDPTPAVREEEQSPETGAQTQTQVDMPQQETTPQVPELEQETSPEFEPLPQQASPTGVAKAVSPAHLLWLLLPGAVGALWLRRWCGLKYRRERCRKGHPNRRAMVWWRWLVHLTKAQGGEVQEEWLCLAEKARFSQHTMTEEELTVLKEAVASQIQLLKIKPWYVRLWHQFGLVLY